MTVLAEAGSATAEPAAAAPATATGPTARTVARSARGPLLVLVAVVLTALVAAAISATGDRGRLDPGAFNPSGARALATLLEDNGVDVRRVTRAADVQPRTDSTVFVPIPGALSPDDLERLASLPGDLVVVGASGPFLTALGAAVDDAGTVPVEVRRPACDLPAATRAGDADTGGVAYRATGSAEVIGCYASGGRATLVRLPDQRLTLLGSGQLMTNAEIDRRGNAALALGLLGAHDDVQWVLPKPGDEESPQGGLGELIPYGLKLAVLQLLVAAGVLALWRARRLGPVVAEPLPVVVRAAEAVEGRSRLYRAARARGTAAEALRAGARDRIGRRLGLPVDAGRAALVDAVAGRTGADPAAVDALLYGAAPGNDAALVALADSLDTLTREVAAS